MGTPQDPCLTMIIMGRSLAVNNDFRAAEIGRAAHQARRDPEGFVAFVLQHLQWGEAEAIARDRAGQDVRALPLLQPQQQAALIPAVGGGR
jgi:hypothetical protein